VKVWPCLTVVMGQTEVVVYTVWVLVALCSAKVVGTTKRKGLWHPSLHEVTVKVEVVVKTEVCPETMVVTGQTVVVT
jgi:hypothetical protein